MFPSDESTFFVLAIITQVIGAVSVAATRLAERSERPSTAQGFFLLCLLAVGLVTGLSLSHGSGTWLFSAATLAVMSIGATLDLRNAPPTHSF